MKTKAILPLLFVLPLGLLAQPATTEVRAAAETALRNGVPQGAIAPIKEAEAAPSFLACSRVCSWPRDNRARH
jgi:hypothetical protein